MRTTPPPPETGDAPDLGQRTHRLGSITRIGQQLAAWSSQEGQRVTEFDEIDAGSEPARLLRRRSQQRQHAWDQIGAGWPVPAKGLRRAGRRSGRRPPRHPLRPAMLEAWSPRHVSGRSGWGWRMPATNGEIVRFAISDAIGNGQASCFRHRSARCTRKGRFMNSPLCPRRARPAPAGG